jgi:hypothetical protein
LLNAGYTKKVFGLLISLNFDYIRVAFEEGCNLACQTLDLIACPTEFETDAV